MAITRDEVLKIAALAKLQFSDAELDAFTAQFQHILRYIEKLREVPVDDVAPTSHVCLPGDCNWQRKDEIAPSLEVEDALKNAPDRGRDHFRVPKVIQPFEEKTGADQPHQSKG